MAESRSTTAPAASSSEVRSFYSKFYSTPGSVNVRDGVKDDDRSPRSHPDSRR